MLRTFEDFIEDGLAFYRVEFEMEKLKTHSKDYQEGRLYALEKVLESAKKISNDKLLEELELETERILENYGYVEEAKDFDKTVGFDTGISFALYGLKHYPDRNRR